MGLYDFTFYDLINRNAVAFGSRVCWQEIDDGRELTFTDYKQKVIFWPVDYPVPGLRKETASESLVKTVSNFFLFTEQLPVLALLCCQSTGGFQPTRSVLTSTTARQK